MHDINISQERWEEIFSQLSPKEQERIEADQAIAIELFFKKMRRRGHEFRIQQVLDAAVTPENRLQGLKPEERLQGLKPEERLAGLTPDELQELIKAAEKAKDRENGNN